MSNPKDLAFFSMLTKLGSLSAVAREFDVTPSAASKWLQKLEQRIGVKLVHRTTRNIRLTSEGQEFLAKGQRILAAIEDLEQSIASKGFVTKGHLKINAPQVMGTSSIASALCQFANNYPEVDVDLVLSDHPMDLVDEAIDACLCFGKPLSTRVVANKLASIRRRIFGSPLYLSQHGVPETPNDLIEHNCLILRQEGQANDVWKLSKGQVTNAVKVTGTLSSNDSEAILRWGVDGQGLFICNEWCAAKYLQSNRLAGVLDDYTLPPTDMYIAYSKNENVAAKVTVFVNFLIEYFRESTV